MKASAVLSSILLFVTSAFIQAQNFTWMKGSSVINQPGIYGTAGTPAPANTPGARSGAACWQDNSGNFWLFGGDGYDYLANNGLLSDLWKYNPVTNQWTFVKGNDIIAQVAVYGTQGVAANANKPGGRTNAMTWTDVSGNLWLFGGFGYDGVSSLGYMSDLWKYNITTNQWTWVAGSNSGNLQGSYGTIGVPSATTYPGSRIQGASWSDNNGFLYLFGGFGTGPNNIYASMNDLWRYDIAQNMWTWLKGSSAVNQFGIYGNKSQPSPANTPGARYAAAFSKDSNGNFWLCGGNGYDSGTPLLTLQNDLWKYNVTTNEWTWVSGSSTNFQNGLYGTQGVASSTNVPGSRQDALCWADGVGNFWMMGGKGFSASGQNIGQLNDVWKYDIAANTWMWVSGGSVLGQIGVYGSQGTPNVNNRPGGRNNGVQWLDGSNNLWLFGGDGFPASGPSDKLNDLWKHANCFVSPITMTITSLDTVICSGENTALIASGSNNYLWSLNSHSLASLPVSPTISTTYTVFTTDHNGCTYSATFTEIVDPCVGIAGNDALLPVQIYPNPSEGKINLRYEGSEIWTLDLRDCSGRIVLSGQIAQGTTTQQLSVDAGLYIAEFTNSAGKRHTTKLIVK